jgi:hypothetical protein
MYTNSTNANQLSLVASTPMTQQKGPKGAGTSWFEAMAQAWGDALNKQADVIQQKSDAISGGDDTPSAVTELTTQSLKMSFLSNNSHTSISTVGQALETMARKQ